MYVPVLSIVFMVINIVIGIAFPIAMFLFLKKKYDCSPAFFGAGCVVFMLFAMVLEGLVNNLFILHTSVGQTIMETTWMYALYGGLAAAVFEEFGRLIAFKTVLKNKMNNDKDAFMYGAGHGGIEVVLVMSLSFVNYVIYAVMINTGTIGTLTATLSGDNLDAFNKIIENLCTGSPYLMLLSPVERLAAVIAHMAFSVLVYDSVKYKKPVLMCLALALHMALDSLSVTFARIIDNALVVELVIYLIVFAIVAIAYFAVKAATKGAYAEVVHEKENLE